MVSRPKGKANFFALPCPKRWNSVPLSLLLDFLLFVHLRYKVMALYSLHISTSGLVPPEQTWLLIKIKNKLCQIKCLDFTLARVLLIVGVEKYRGSEKWELCSVLAVVQSVGLSARVHLLWRFFHSCSSFFPVIQPVSSHVKPHEQEDMITTSSCHHGGVWFRQWRTRTIEQNSQGEFVSKQISYVLQLTLLPFCGCLMYILKQWRLSYT